MFIHNPKYVLQINQPQYPETEAQYFERLHKEHMAKKKQEAKAKRIAVIKQTFGKVFRFADKPLSAH